MNRQRQSPPQQILDTPRIGIGSPTISVITVTYNAARVFKDTAESIRSQRSSNVEWIVIDGGSTDGTPDLLKTNEDIITHWQSEPDHGMYDALAKGFEHATGEIVCWLNAGDIFLPGALVTIAEVFQRNKSVNWLCGMQFWHLPGGRIIDCYLPPAYNSELIRCGAYGTSLPYIQQESTFFRRSMLNEIDMTRFRNFKLAGDLYMWTCFAKLHNLTTVCAGLGSFCIHSGQLSEDKQAYWKEATTFLRSPGLRSWLQIQLRRLLTHAPSRIKRKVAGKAMLVWTNDRGWV
jgi:glycosyltransferase involved in cell wall biosynthesis